MRRRRHCALGREIVKVIQELRAARNQYAVFEQELAELRVTWKAKLLATLG